MTSEIKMELVSAGVQVDDALSRLLENESLLERILKKFLEDRSYISLCEALENHDIQGAFMASHTLKGICGNLSMNELYDHISDQVECLRREDLAAAEDLMPQITQDYNILCHAIRHCFAA